MAHRYQARLHASDSAVSLLLQAHCTSCRAASAHRIVGTLEPHRVRPASREHRVDGLISWCAPPPASVDRADNRLRACLDIDPLNDDPLDRAFSSSAIQRLDLSSEGSHQLSG